jgi:hypothetical protein
MPGAGWACPVPWLVETEKSRLNFWSDRKFDRELKFLPKLPFLKGLKTHSDLGDEIGGKKYLARIQTHKSIETTPLNNVL